MGGNWTCPDQGENLGQIKTTFVHRIRLPFLEQHTYTSGLWSNFMFSSTLALNMRLEHVHRLGMLNY